jgi:hypothetical protein
MGSFLPSFFSKKLANLRVSAMLTGGTHLPRASPTNQNLKTKGEPKLSFYYF